MPLVSRQTLLNNKVDLRSSDFVVSQAFVPEVAAPQRGACAYVHACVDRWMNEWTDGEIESSSSGPFRSCRLTTEPTRRTLNNPQTTRPHDGRQVERHPRTHQFCQEHEEDHGGHAPRRRREGSSVLSPESCARVCVCVYTRLRVPNLQRTADPNKNKTKQHKTTKQVRRAQEAVLSTRPFNEGLQSVFSGLVKRLAVENIELPLLQVGLAWGRGRVRLG